MEADKNYYQYSLINHEISYSENIELEKDSVDVTSNSSDEGPKNNIYYNRQIFNFEEIENIVNAQNFLSFKTDQAILEYITEIEKIIMLKIKYLEDLSKFHKKILKEMSYSLLENKIREYKGFKGLYKQIKLIFNNFFDAFAEDSNLMEIIEDEETISKILNQNIGDPTEHVRERSISLSHHSFMKKFQKDSKKVNLVLGIVKKIYKKNLSFLIEKFKLHFLVENFPFFLIRDAKCRIKRKINKKYIPKFKEIYLRNNFLNSLEYLIIAENIKDISLKNLEIFDEKVLSLEIREILLKIIFIILKSTFSHITDEYFVKNYHEIIQKILLALNIHIRNESNIQFNLTSEFNSENFCDKYKDSNTYLNMQKIIKLLEQNTSNTNLKELFQNLEICIKNNLDTYLFIILSLSLLFNNFDLSSKTIVKTCAREKETLRKILLAFNENYQYDNFDVRKFNQIMESVIFSHFFLRKYILNFSNTNEKQINSQSDLVKTKLTFANVNSLFNSDQYYLHKELKENYEILIEKIPQKGKVKRCAQICRFFKEFFLPYKEKSITVDLNQCSLVPYDNYNYSNNLCIIVPGFISQNHNNHIQWENFIIDFDIYVDFYFFVWDAKTGIKILNDMMKFLGGLSLTLLTRNFLNVFSAYKTYQHKNNIFAKTTKIGKYCGKFLAYVLASKFLVQKRTVTLVGYSLGGHVIKHCVKELQVISEYLPEIKDLVQNVVFIGAATCLPEKYLWRNINTMIGGRIINCYCDKDEVLRGVYKYITKQDPLGIKPLLFENSENGIYIENYDFTELEIKHEEYKCYLNEIIKKINLF